MHEWVKCASRAMGLELWGDLRQKQSKTIVTAWGSVRWVGWEGGGDLE